MTVARVVHVAEAGENRGRVVLRLGSAAPNATAIEAALRVARAYQAELESVFVEDQQLIDLCSQPDAFEVSLCGRDRRRLSPVTLARQFAYASRAAESRIAKLAAAAEIPYRARTIRDDPVHALDRACAEAGPWNIIALADPIAASDRDAVLQLVAGISGATGLLVVGTAIRRNNGPIVAAVEDVDHIQPMLRVAERLAAVSGDPIKLVLAAAMRQEPGALETAARLLLADRTDVEVVMSAPVYGHVGVLIDSLRRRVPGLVIGQTGGSLLPLETGWGDLVRSLECPLFVVR